MQEVKDITRIERIGAHSHIRGLGLDDAQTRSLVTKVPQLLGLSYEAEVAPKLDALSDRLGCASDAELAKQLLAKPSELLKAGIEVRGSAAAVRRAGPGAAGPLS